MRILTRSEIQKRFNASRAIDRLVDGFICDWHGDVQLPASQNFRFEEADGDCCIKSAYVAGQPTFFVKVSTGFYQNPSRGLPSNNGLILGLSAQTGEPVVLLQDEGWLTCIRTALTGAIVARLMAPETTQCIGVLGTGEQARLQLQCLRDTISCRSVVVWGRGAPQLELFCRDASQMGFDVAIAPDAEGVARKCNLIVTTTPSRGPLLQREWIRPGTHITAVGADAPGKQELDARIVGDAAVVLVDSRKQCAEYGELSHAIRASLRTVDGTISLGAALATGDRLRTEESQITVADLTGLAIQDAAVAASLLDED
jgi:ornithine cyclodeaminase